MWLKHSNCIWSVCVLSAGPGALACLHNLFFLNYVSCNRTRKQQNSTKQTLCVTQTGVCICEGVCVSVSLCVCSCVHVCVCGSMRVNVCDLSAPPALKGSYLFCCHHVLIVFKVQEFICSPQPHISSQLYTASVQSAHVQSHLHCIHILPSLWSVRNFPLFHSEWILYSLMDVCG